MRSYIIFLALLPLFNSFGQSLSDSVSSNVDLVKARSEKILDSISTVASFKFLEDSLIINTWTDQLKSKVTQRFSPSFLTHYGDSLRTMKVPEPEIGRRFDSLLMRKASLLEEVSQKQQELQGKVNGRYENWASSLREKFNFDSAGVKVPSADLSNAPVRAPNTSMPGLPIAQISSLPDIPSVPSLASSDFSSLGLSANLSAVGGSTAIPSAPQLSEWQKSLPAMPDAMGELNKHVVGIKGLASNPSEVVEKTATQVATGSGAMNQLKEGEEMKKRAETLKSADPESMKEQAANQFKEAELQGAMKQVSKYKSKYATIGSLSEIPKNDWLPKNGLKGKPFQERFRTGINLGFRSNSDTVLVDLYPNASYRITGRLEAGLGGIYRLRASTNPLTFDQRDPVWGLAMFAVVKTFKSVFVRLETNSTSHMKYSTEQPAYRDWRWTFHMGVQTNFRLSKRLTGNVQMLYNFDSNLKDGFPEKLTARVGVQYLLKGPSLKK